MIRREATALEIVNDRHVAACIKHNWKVSVGDFWVETYDGRRKKGDRVCYKSKSFDRRIKVIDGEPFVKMHHELWRVRGVYREFDDGTSFVSGLTIDDPVF